jgi:hypothetical protein
LRSLPALTRRFFALPILVLALVAGIAAGCSSSSRHNSNGTAQTPAAATAATRPSSPSSAAANQATAPAAASRPGTPTPAAAASPIPPIGPPSAALVEVARGLQPYLFQTADLPGGERDFQSGPPQPVANEDLVRGRPDAQTLLAKYESAGRLGGISGGWAKPGGQLTPQTKSLYLLVCSLSRYRDAAGAEQGVAIARQQLETTPRNPTPAITTTISQLQPVAVGNGAAAFREDDAIQGTSNGQIFIVHQVAYIQVWQRGPIVAQCGLTAINEDPPLSDFQQIVRAQDARLQQGGF